MKLEQLPGDIRLHDLHEGAHRIGGADVTALEVPHLGRTYGYRVAFGGAVVAYLSDHQMPLDGSLEAPANAIELCRDADLVIHDAQYTSAEFAHKAHWGHCTPEFALAVAARAGARRVALFHHDPLRTDEMLDAATERYQACGAAAGLEVLVAAEGLTVSLAGA